MMSARLVVGCAKADDRAVEHIHVGERVHQRPLAMANVAGKVERGLQGSAGLVYCGERHQARIAADPFLWPAPTS